MAQLQDRTSRSPLPSDANSIVQAPQPQAGPADPRAQLPRDALAHAKLICDGVFRLLVRGVAPVGS